MRKVLYAIYDLEDNYIFEGTIKELCEYSGRSRASIESTISHIKHSREKRKLIKLNGKKYTITKMEE